MTHQPQTEDFSPTAPLLVDVAIVGAGLSGALLALKLARDGVSVAVVDLAATYQSDFRCEKLSPRQIGLLDELGLTEAVAPAVAPGQFSDGSGFHYEGLVNAARANWPSQVRFILDRVADIAPRGLGDDQRQVLTSQRGEIVSARLVVLATGLSPKLIKKLGLTRRDIRDQQSVCLGFSLKRKDDAPAAFENFVHWGERAGDKIGYASIFPIGDKMRLNLFCYHAPTDAWVQEVRRDPLTAIPKAAPGLTPLFAGMEVAGAVETRAIGLYRTEGVERAGLVVIGDAYQTSCPATTFGVTRLLTDIQRLCAHIPAWLATPGMEPGKIAAFYADPVKQSVDAEGLRRAARDRAAAVETSLFWRSYRILRAVKADVLARAEHLRRLRQQRHATSHVSRSPGKRQSASDRSETETAGASLE